MDEIVDRVTEPSEMELLLIADRVRLCDMEPIENPPSPPPRPEREPEPKRLREMASRPTLSIGRLLCGAWTGVVGHDRDSVRCWKTPYWWTGNERRSARDSECSEWEVRSLVCTTLDVTELVGMISAASSLSRVWTETLRNRVLSQRDVLLQTPRDVRHTCSDFPRGAAL